MTILADPTAWNTSPITASLHAPVNRDAPVSLPHLTSEPMVGAAEAAVLFAAGHAGAARICLEEACEAQPHSQPNWLLLLDLHRVQDQRELFDAVSERYRLACPDGPRPIWTFPARPSESSETLQLAGRLSADQQLRPIFDYAHSRKLVAIDLGEVSRIDFELAPDVCAMLRLFVLQSKRVILTRVSPLHWHLFVTVGLHSGVVMLRQHSGSDDLALTPRRELRAA